MRQAKKGSYGNLMQKTAIVAGTIPKSANLRNMVELNWGLGLVFKLDQERIRGKVQWMIKSGK